MSWESSLGPLHRCWRPGKKKEKEKGGGERRWSNQAQQRKRRGRRKKKMKKEEGQVKANLAVEHCSHGAQNLLIPSESGKT